MMNLFFNSHHIIDPKTFENSLLELDTFDYLKTEDKYLIPFKLNNIESENTNKSLKYDKAMETLQKHKKSLENFISKDISNDLLNNNQYSMNFDLNKNDNVISIMESNSESSSKTYISDLISQKSIIGPSSNNSHLKMNIFNKNCFTKNLKSHNKKKRIKLNAKFRNLNKNKIIEKTISNELQNYSNSNIINPINEYVDIMINKKNIKKYKLISCSDQDIQRVILKDPEIGFEFSSLVRKNVLKDVRWERLSKKIKSLNFYFCHGKYTFLEMKKLYMNWEELKNIIPFDDPLIIFNYTQNKEKNLIKEFIDDNNIFQRLGRGLKRTLYSVYVRARCVLFIQTEKDGIRWTDDEVTKLKKLHAKFGKKWISIGKKLGRSSQSCRDKINFIQNEPSGPWTAEEDQKLVDAVTNYIKGKRDIYTDYINKYNKRHSNLENGSNYEENMDVEDNTDSIKITTNGIIKNNREYCIGMPWAEISKEVPRRNGIQCRMRWLYTLMNNKEPKYVFTMEEKIKLIDILLKIKVPSESYIDWFELIPIFRGIPSSQYLLHQWHCLKSSIPDYYVKSLYEILSELDERFKKKSQRLKKKEITQN